MSTYEDAVQVVKKPSIFSENHPKSEVYFKRLLYATGIVLMLTTVNALEAQNERVTTGFISTEILDHGTRLEHAGMGVVHIADVVGVDYLER